MREDKQLAKLVKNIAAKDANAKRDRSEQYEATRRKKPPEQDEENKRFFKEMKRREF